MSTLLISCLRTLSSRSGNVRTFETSCCIGDLVEAGVGVEPSKERPLAGGQVDVVDVTRKQDVAPRQRGAALVRVDHSELPAADQNIERRRDVRSITAPPAERQFDERADREPVRHVFGRDPLPGLRIGRIQELGGLFEPGVGVVDADGVAVGEAAVESAPAARCTRTRLRWSSCSRRRTADTAAAAARARWWSHATSPPRSAASGRRTGSARWRVRKSIRRADRAWGSCSGTRWAARSGCGVVRICEPKLPT